MLKPHWNMLYLKKRRFYLWLLILGVLVFIFDCSDDTDSEKTILNNDVSYQAESDNKTAGKIVLRYDGLYQAESESDYFYYLRFYQDGTVLSTSSTGNSRQVARWFNKEKPSLSKGRYTTLGSKIKFSTTSSYGTVDYQGEIKEKSLILDSYSHINGHKANYKFFFMKLKLR